MFCDIIYSGDFMASKEKYIYTKDIPMFERYEFIDYGVYRLLSTTLKGKVNKMGSYSFYIKGINRRKNSNNFITIPEKSFFDDYLKLGKDLFELASAKNKVCFNNNYFFDDSSNPQDNFDRQELKSFFVEQIVMDTNFTKEQLELLRKIDKINYYYAERTDCTHMIKYTDTIESIINSLTILLYYTKYDITDLLKKLYNVLKKTLKKYKNIENNRLVHQLFFGLETFEFEEINDEIRELEKMYDIDIRKDIRIGNKKNLNTITKWDFDEKFGFSPLKVFFSCDQIVDLSKIIIKWLEIYGFPYFVYNSDKEEYLKKIKKIFGLECYILKEEGKELFEKNRYKKSNYYIIKDDNKVVNYIEKVDDPNYFSNEMFIPCEPLIVNSIYNYLIYTILTQQQTADEKIKEVFYFKTPEKVGSKIDVKENLKFTYETKTNYSKLDSNMNMKILDFKTKYEKIEFDGKKDYSESDNKFKYKPDNKKKKDDFDDSEFSQIFFHNLCEAATLLTQEKITRIGYRNDKQCKFCGKFFTPTEKNKIYCSEECRKKARNKKIMHTTSDKKE